MRNARGLYAVVMHTADLRPKDTRIASYEALSLHVRPESQKARSLAAHSERYFRSAGPGVGSEYDLVPIEPTPQIARRPQGRLATVCADVICGRGHPSAVRQTRQTAEGREGFYCLLEAASRCERS